VYGITKRRQNRPESGIISFSWLLLIQFWIRVSNVNISCRKKEHRNRISQPPCLEEDPRFGSLELVKMASCGVESSRRFLGPPDRAFAQTPSFFFKKCGGFVEIFLCFCHLRTFSISLHHSSGLTLLYFAFIRGLFAFISSFQLLSFLWEFFGSEGLAKICICSSYDLFYMRRSCLLVDHVIL
jgi:hypothetical protein